MRLHHADQYGAAAQTIGRWAEVTQSRGLLANMVLATYRPETGRFGTGTALTAAETVFAADTALTVARLASPMNPQAATAVGVLDIAHGFLGHQGPRWLVDHLTHGGGPPLDRKAAAETRHPVTLPPGILERHRTALTAYRALTAPSDVDTIMTDLIHLHHARMIGVSDESEKTCLRLARAAAQRLLTHPLGSAS